MIPQARILASQNNQSNSCIESSSCDHVFASQKHSFQNLAKIVHQLSVTKQTKTENFYIVFQKVKNQVFEKCRFGYNDTFLCFCHKCKNQHFAHLDQLLSSSKVSTI